MPNLARRRETIKRALAYYWNREVPREVPESLPLVDEFRRSRPAPDAFASVSALFIQHHLVPFVPRLRAMVEEGVPAERMWFVDIPYSTNRTAWSAVRSLGCPVDQAAENFDDPLAPYSKSQLARVQGIVRRLAKAAPERCLVVDDGAYFVRALAATSPKERSDLLERFRGRTHIVEQTTRGYRYLKEEPYMRTVFELDAPVVSVARSYTKTFLEGPFIGAAVARAVRDALRKAGRRDVSAALVIGFGTVGEATTRALRNANEGARIDVFDTDPGKARAIAALGARPLPAFPDRGEYDLVVGCTGYGSFPLEKRSIVADEAVLASGSSAAVELNRERFVELADRLPEDEIEILDRDRTLAGGIHAAIRFRDHGRRFSFLNAGFPVNFDGEPECLPPLLIQPTHCLLFAASRQSLLSEGASLSFLNFIDDFWIFREGMGALEREFA